jgi:hypothetical protein
MHPGRTALCPPRYALDTLAYIFLFMVDKLLDLNFSQFRFIPAMKKESEGKIPTNVLKLQMRINEFERMLDIKSTLNLLHDVLWLSIDSSNYVDSVRDYTNQ